METIGFIGAFDKTDFIMHVAKILQNLNKKILVIDTTLMQKTKYTVPSINPTRSYITEFEQIDFAVGFEKIEDIERYLGIKYDSNNEEDAKENEETNENNMSYDYVLIDIDSYKMLENYEINKANKNYFLTSFDTYSLKRGIEIFADLREPLKLTKILFSYEQTKEEEDYLNYISLEYNIEWNDYTIYFPILSEDIQAMQENQRIEKISLKKISVNYKESLANVIQDITGKKESMGKIKKAMKD